jgi:hypothetical protein
VSIVDEVLGAWLCNVVEAAELLLPGTHDAPVFAVFTLLSFVSMQREVIRLIIVERINLSSESSLLRPRRIDICLVTSESSFAMHCTVEYGAYTHI